MTTTRSRSRRRLLATLGAATCAALSIAACGSRGPLDVDVVDWDGGAAMDASTGPDTGPEKHPDAAADSAAHDAQPEGLVIDTGIPIIDCVGCVAQSCGNQLLACVSNPACQKTIQCIGQMCLGGSGGVNPLCIQSCNTDPAATAQAVRVLECVLTQCGTPCTSAIGTIGGGGRGDGGGGGGGGAGG